MNITNIQKVKVIACRPALWKRFVNRKGERHCTNVQAALSECFLSVRNTGYCSLGRVHFSRFTTCQYICYYTDGTKQTIFDWHTWVCHCEHSVSDTECTGDEGLWSGVWTSRFNEWNVKWVSLVLFHTELKLKIAWRLTFTVQIERSAGFSRFQLDLLPGLSRVQAALLPETDDSCVSVPPLLWWLSQHNISRTAHAILDL
jgi:hypothetical protein